nr:COP9 signalosome complex subunit 3-like [Ipomoea batatas]
MKVEKIVFLRDKRKKGCSFFFFSFADLPKIASLRMSFWEDKRSLFSLMKLLVNNERIMVLSKKLTDMDEHMSYDPLIAKVVKEKQIFDFVDFEGVAANFNL